MADQNHQNDAYQVLGIAPETPIKEIQQTYLKLLETWKPEAIDRTASPALYEMALAKQQDITAAYQRIADQYAPAPTGAALDGTVTAQPGDETRLQGQGAPMPLEESTQAGSAPPQTPISEGEVSASGETGISQGYPAEGERPQRPPGKGDRRVILQPALAPTAMEDVPDMMRDRRSQARQARHPSAPAPNSAASVLSLLRWNKPAGRLILLLPALWAAFLAAGNAQPTWRSLLIILLGSLATSAVGCAVNDLWDQDIDPLVERTQDRPLAAGTMSRGMAIGVAVVAGVVAIGIAALLQPLSWILCALAAVVILLYPAAKRLFPLPQLVLAIAWGFAVLIGWTVVANALPPAAWILWLATVLWTLGFDTVYAMADREDDQRIGVQSSALLFGDRSPQAVGLFFLGTALLLLWLGWTQALGVWYWISLSLVTLGWLTQYRRLDSHRLRPTSQIYGQIFSGNVGLGFLLLLGIILGRGAL